jgi:integrase/recombinase XerD
MTPIAPLIEAFLVETLTRQRGVSRHTRHSYALSFQLLFMFAAKRLKVSPSALTLEQLDAGLVSAFLEHLEDKRKHADPYGRGSSPLPGARRCPAARHL